MKKIKNVLFLLCSFFILVSCSSSSDSEDSDDPNATADLIIGNWKLTGYNTSSGTFQGVPTCFLLFQKYDANGAFTLTSDRCGDLGGFSGTWVKTSVANQYKVTQTDGTIDYATVTFTENNTKYYISSPNVDTQVFQKQ
jgi:hypothetical protein